MSLPWSNEVTREQFSDLFEDYIDEEFDEDGMVVVEFESRINTNQEWVSGNITPYVRLESRKFLENMKDPNDVVINMDQIHVEIDYPLKKSVVFKLIADDQNKGFERRELALKICDCYKAIYAGETACVGDPGYIEGTYNRQSSNGPYGIYDHYMSDLLLVNVYQTSHETFCLVVDS